MRLRQEIPDVLPEPCGRDPDGSGKRGSGMTGLNAFLSGIVSAVAARSLFDVWRLFRNRRLPPPGEAWCENCCVNNGRRKIISPDGLKEHLSLHPPESHVEIRAAWPKGRR
jgi:hypothetical protein